MLSTLRDAAGNQQRKGKSAESSSHPRTVLQCADGEGSAGKTRTDGVFTVLPRKWSHLQQLCPHLPSSFVRTSWTPPRQLACPFDSLACGCDVMCLTVQRTRAPQTRLCVRALLSFPSSGTHERVLHRKRCMFHNCSKRGCVASRRWEQPAAQLAVCGARPGFFRASGSGGHGAPPHTQHTLCARRSGDESQVHRGSVPLPSPCCQ